MTGALAARESVTAKSRVAPGPSWALASATLSAGGPWMVWVSAVSRRRPSAVHTAPAAVQSAVAGSVTVTAPWPDGLTVSAHRSLRFFTRTARASVPPDTCIAASFARPATGALNATRSASAPLARCSDGAAVKRAVSGAAGFGGACTCGCPAGVSFVTVCPENAATAAPPPDSRSPPEDGGV